MITTRHMPLAGAAADGHYEADCNCGWAVKTETLNAAADLALGHLAAYAG